MTSRIDEIVRRLHKRRKAIRGLVDGQSHSLVAAQARSAFDALSAMITLVQQLAPVLATQLAERESELDQQASDEERERSAERAEAQRLRRAADAEDDEEQAQMLSVMAKSYQRMADAPGNVELKRQLWHAGSHLTLSNLLSAAEHVSEHRDVEAMRSLGKKSAGLVAKWALKLTPVRYEDLEDFKEAWEMLKKITEPGEDLIAALEAAGLRKAQSRAASSLLNQLDAVRDISLEWCLRAHREPFIAIAEAQFDEESAGAASAPWD